MLFEYCNAMLVEYFMFMMDEYFMLCCLNNVMFVG